MNILIGDNMSAFEKEIKTLKKNLHKLQALQMKLRQIIKYLDNNEYYNKLPCEVIKLTIHE